MKQPNLNNHMIGQQFDDQMIGEPFSGQVPREPFNGRMPGEPYNDQMIGQPFNNRMIWEPYDDQMIGEPFTDRTIWEPYDDLMIRQSGTEQMIGQPHNSGAESSPEPTPYYQMYGYSQMFMEEQGNEIDVDRLKEMYPETAKHILTFVEDECDKLEYEGSFMFDERPDVNSLSKIKNEIYDQVKGKYDLPTEEDSKEIYTMNWEKNRRFPPGKNWLGDMVEVLLLQEMFRRRCRFRNCCGRRC